MNITIYSLQTCPKCKMVEMKLRQKGVTFNECQDVAKMHELGIMSAPALQVDDKLLLNLTEINAFVNGL